MSPGPAALLLAAAGAAALLADRLWAVAAVAASCSPSASVRPPSAARSTCSGRSRPGRRLPALASLVEPDGTVLWEGPTIAVLGPLDVTTTELYEAALNALRKTALALAFAAYALLLDHDRPWRPRAPPAARPRRRARDPARADARARRRAFGRVGARPWCPARGRAGLRAAALAARCGLARARDESRRGDGGARLRPGSTWAPRAP